jgi:hypothetical protein
MRIYNIRFQNILYRGLSTLAQAFRRGQKESIIVKYSHMEFKYVKYGLNLQTQQILNQKSKLKHKQQNLTKRSCQNKPHG